MPRVCNALNGRTIIMDRVCSDNSLVDSSEYMELTIAGMVCLRHCGRGGTCAPRSGDGQCGGGGAWKGACGRDRLSPDAPSACGGSGGLGVQARDRRSAGVVERVKLAVMHHVRGADCRLNLSYMWTSDRLSRMLYASVCSARRRGL